MPPVVVMYRPHLAPSRRRSPLNRLVGTALLVPLVSMLVASGCGDTEPPPPKVELPRTMKFKAVKPVNKSADGPSVVTVVRVVPMSGVAEFDAAAFDELWQDPKTALGDAMVGQYYEFKIFPEADLEVPAKIQSFDPALPETTRFLGVIALFHNVDRSEWHGRQHAAMPTESAKSQTVILSGTNITFQTESE
jgi:type VI secretion system VasD/TssJ family lipoprotein